MRRYLSLIVLLLAATRFFAAAQSYEAPEVTISSEKANIAGKIYYVHKVEPKQTIYSICKAYGTTQEALLEANPSLEDGLKSGSTILIPEETPEEGAAAGVKPDGNGSEGKWYDKFLALFKTKDKDSRPAAKEEPSEDSGMQPDTVAAASVPEVAASSGIPSEGLAAPRVEFSSERPIRVSLLLPFNASSSPEQNYFDFYSGVLMALRELKADGFNIELHVFDTKSGNPLGSIKLRNSDLIVGPVHASDIAPYAEFAKEHKIPIVSPMDLRSERFIEDNPYFFLAPATDSIRLNNTVRSIRAKAGDKVHVFYNSSMKEAALVRRVKAELDRNGVTYANVAYDLLRGRELGQHLGRQWADHSTHKVIVASEDEAFAPDVVRNIRLITRSEVPVEIYCSNALRGFEGSIDYDTFYRTEAHISAPYWVDYSDAETEDFVLKYRALFNTEPTAFSFQGHDIMKYFVSMMEACGGNFEDTDTLPEIWGLQCNMQFRRRNEKSGWQNIATRNLIFSPDFTVKLDDSLVSQ